MRATIFFILIAAAIIVGIVLLLRSRRLKEKYAALWMVVGLLCIVLAAWPGSLNWAANLVGIQVPSNLLFALAIVLLLAVCLHLSLEVSSQEDKIRRLAEESAIARQRLEQLGGEAEEKSASDDAIAKAAGRD